MWNTVLFDLDGTLTASAEGITKSVQYALEKMGRDVPSQEDLLCFVGPPLKEEFMRFAHLSEEEARMAVEYYRERYSTKGIFENRPFEGIAQMLQTLQSRGYTLAVASSKPTVFVKQILEHYEMQSFFSVICGSEMDGTRTEKGEVIKEALRQLGCMPKREGLVMVGDKKHDVKGAHTHQIPCIGVAYGYGGREELSQAGADWIADSVGELQQLLLSSFWEDKREDPLGCSGMQAPFSVKLWRCVYPLGVHYLAGMTVVFAAHFIWMSGMLATGLGNILALPFLFAMFRQDERRRGLWSGKKAVLSVKTCAAAVFFAAAASQIVNIWMQILRLDQLFPVYSESWADFTAHQTIGIQLLVVGILAPLAEEVTFRGLIYRRIREYTTPVWGMVLSAVMFGLYHGNAIQFIYAAILGVVIAWLYERTGRLWIPILAHMGINMWSTLLPEVFEAFSLSGFACISVILAEIAVVIYGACYFFRYHAKIR